MPSKHVLSALILSLSSMSLVVRRPLVKQNVSSITSLQAEQRSNGSFVRNKFCLRSRKTDVIATLECPGSSDNERIYPLPQLFSRLIISDRSPNQLPHCGQIDSLRWKADQGADHPSRTQSFLLRRATLCSGSTRANEPKGSMHAVVFQNQH